MDDPVVAEALEQIRNLPRNERTERLNLILSTSDDPIRIAFNARLITALREAELWPMGCVP